LTRLLDFGIDRIRKIIMDMSSLSEKSVITAINAYEKGQNAKNEIFDWSEELRVLQDEVSDLAIELIARYQPVATDLRFIRSCMEIAYGFSRFGRYAYDIVEVLETIGPIPECDKTDVLDTSKVVREMIHTSVQALQSRDKNAAQKLYRMDDAVDAAYRQYFRNVIVSSANKNMELQQTILNPKCYTSALLILRYLERISDHACYIADSVHYIVTGESRPRR
jgi:phosphate transport system protein